MNEGQIYWCTERARRGIENVSLAERHNDIISLAASVEDQATRHLDGSNHCGRVNVSVDGLLTGKK